MKFDFDSFKAHSIHSIFDDTTESITIRYMYNVTCFNLVTKFVVASDQPVLFRSWAKPSVNLQMIKTKKRCTGKVSDLQTNQLVSLFNFIHISLRKNVNLFFKILSFLWSFPIIINLLPVLIYKIFQSSLDFNSMHQSNHPK